MFVCDFRFVSASIVHRWRKQPAKTMKKGLYRGKKKVVPVARLFKSYNPMNISKICRKKFSEIIWPENLCRTNNRSNFAPSF